MKLYPIPKNVMLVMESGFFKLLGKYPVLTVSEIIFNITQNAQPA